MKATELTAADWLARRNEARAEATSREDAGDHSGAATSRRRAESCHRAWVRAQVAEFRSAPRGVSP